MYRLSIITINYNNLAGLKKTIASVISQTWREFEYIVIDGGSTDGSASYIERQKRNIDYWISEQDSGIYNAMNKAIRVAKGEYLFFLNSVDDFVDCNSLSLITQFLVNYDIVYCNINMINDKNAFIKKSPQIITPSFLFKDTIPHQATFIKKYIFEKLGYYDESLKIVADWKFFLIAFMQEKVSYKYVDTVFSNFYLDGISSQVGCVSERNSVLMENFQLFHSDYEELFKNREILQSNRFKLLLEIEKSIVGRKITSLFLRTFALFFLKRSVKDILSKK